MAGDAWLGDTTMAMDPVLLRVTGATKMDLWSSMQQWAERKALSGEPMISRLAHLRFELAGHMGDLGLAFA